MCGRARSSVPDPDSSVAERQHRGIQRVFPERLVVAQVAEHGQRVSEPVHGRLRQPGALREIAIAEHRFAGPERAQQVEPARKRNDELAFVDRGFVDG
jgi:hypothetical protein